MTMVKKSDFVDEARRWIGTPYQHQCSVCGQGADCLGLLRGVWRGVLGQEPMPIPVYTPDWTEISGKETLFDGAKALLRPVDIDQPGDILLFRMRRGAVAKHLAVRAQSPTGVPTIIHAYSKRGVVETALTEPWRRKIVARFEFPTRG
ncbi:MAG: peptidase [Pseudomonadota bacterium]